MMLRVFVLVAAMLAFTAAVICVVFVPMQWPLLVWTGVLLAGTLFERARYGAAQARPGADWQETAERFIDPESGRPTVVWFNPRTGERRYVATPVDADAFANELH